MSDFKDININTDKIQAEHWLKKQLATHKNIQSLSKINKEVILRDIEDVAHLEILLEKGLKLDTNLFNAVFVPTCRRFAYATNTSDKNNKISILLDKLIEIKNKDLSIELYYNTVFHPLSHSQSLARKFKDIDVDWAIVQNYTGGIQSLSLYDLSPASANVLLKSKHNFKNMKGNEKNDFLYKMACLNFSSLSNSIIKKTSTAKVAKNNLLNALMSMLDDEYLQKFIKEHKSVSPSFKVGKDYIFNGSTKKWIFKAMGESHTQPIGISKNNFLKISKKKNKSLRDVEFLKNYGVDFSDPKSSIYLLDAIKSSNLKVCKYLVEECGVKLGYLNDKSIYHFINKQNPSILHECLHEVKYIVKPSIIKFLILQGENVNLSNHEGKTPLFKAVKNKNFEAIKLLLKHGADINHKDNMDQNVLYDLSIDYKPSPTNIEIAEYLIKNGLDPFHKSSITNKTFIETMEEGSSQNYWRDNIKTELNTLNEFVLSLSAHQIKKHTTSPSIKKKKRKL